METKKTLRYFGHKKETKDFDKQLIDSSIDLPEDSRNGQKIVKNWENDRKEKKQFVGNRFVTKERLKKYERRDKLDIVLYFVVNYLLTIYCLICSLRRQTKRS